MPHPYFDEPIAVNRQRLLWTVATRRQLERWEPFVADSMRSQFGLGGPPLDGAAIWQASIEHHFVLIAARNLFHALDLADATGIEVDETLRSELTEGRDLNEHWDENMPVFNVWPHRSEPQHRTGKTFLERNPKRSPYGWLGWSQYDGAMVTPNVSARALHKLLDSVEAHVLAAEPTMAPFVPERQSSQWVLTDRNEWWPRMDDVVES